MTCIAFGSAPSDSLAQALRRATEEQDFEVLYLPLCKKGISREKEPSAWPTLTRPGRTREHVINQALANTSGQKIVLLNAALAVGPDIFKCHAFALGAHVNSVSMGPISCRTSRKNDVLALYLAQPGLRVDLTLIPDENDVAGNFFSSDNVAFRRDLLEGNVAYREDLEGQAADVDWGRRLYQRSIKIRMTPQATASLLIDEPLEEALNAWVRCGTRIHQLMAHYPDPSHRLALVRFVQKTHLEASRYQEAVEVTSRVLAHFEKNHNAPTDDELRKAFNMIAILHNATLAKGFLSRLDSEVQRGLLEMSLKTTPDPASEAHLFSERSA